jgi:Ca2+-binding EF-hand superfamily protein
VYKRADRNKDGVLDIGEFARAFDVERRNPFLPRLVRLFDLSGDGEMSAFEFVVCLSQFRGGSGSRGRLGHAEHVYFAWRLFDVDDDGAMTKEEFRRVLGATYFRGEIDSDDDIVGGGADRKGRGLANFGGVGGKAKGLDSIMREVDDDGDGRVTIKEFSRMTRKYQHVLAPAFDLWTAVADLSKPAAEVYRQVKAAGNVARLVDLAMCESDERARRVAAASPADAESHANAAALRREDSPGGMKAFRAAERASGRDVFERRGDATRTNRRSEGGRGGNWEREREEEEEEKHPRAREPALDPVRTGPGRRPRPTARGAARAAAEDSETNVSFPEEGEDEWRLPSLDAPRTPPPPKTAEELEMDRLFADSPVSPEGRMYERARR